LKDSPPGDNGGVWGHGRFLGVCGDEENVALDHCEDVPEGGGKNLVDEGDRFLG